MSLNLKPEPENMEAADPLDSADLWRGGITSQISSRLVRKRAAEWRGRVQATGAEAYSSVLAGSAKV